MAFGITIAGFPTGVNPIIIPFLLQMSHATDYKFARRTTGNPYMRITQEIESGTPHGLQLLRDASREGLTLCFPGVGSARAKE